MTLTATARKYLDYPTTGKATECISDDQNALAEEIMTAMIKIFGQFKWAFPGDDRLANVEGAVREYIIENAPPCMDGSPIAQSDSWQDFLTWRNERNANVA